MLPRFYAPHLLIDAERLTLAGDEALHLTRVLRLGPGAALRVFDGRGLERTAVVDAVRRGEVTLDLGDRVDAARELPFRLTLASAVLKGDAMDGIVRDATMLGVTAIQPVVTGRSEVPMAALERGRRHERWHRIAISSAKQCRRAVVPDIAQPAGFTAALNLARGRAVLVLIEPSAPIVSSAVSVLDRIPTGDGVVVFVGPEGGWSEQELTEAAEAGARLVTLGDRTLRADAMALVALPVLLYVWGEL